MKILNVPHSKVNVNGGAVSLGHPVGYELIIFHSITSSPNFFSFIFLIKIYIIFEFSMSGARVIQSLITVLKQRGQKIGMAGICNGGGGASSVILEAL